MRTNVLMIKYFYQNKHFKFSESYLPQANLVIYLSNLYHEFNNNIPSSGHFYDS